jgi:NADH-quinone oxidoreductase subunit N
MIPTPHVDWFAIAPELCLLGAATVCLLAAVLVPRWGRRPVSAIACTLGFAGALATAVVLYVESPAGHDAVAGAIVRNRWSSLTQILIAAAGFVVVFIAYSEPMRDDHIGEFYALLAAAGGGMLFLAQANNLMTLFLGLEWFSICLYILCAIDVDHAGSLEAGLKYLIVGSFGSAVLLFGSALVYGATGELQFEKIAAAVTAQGLSRDMLLLIGLAMLLAGLGFKASAAPFHMWTPDVYEGAPTPVTAFMSAATKAVALTLMLRVLVTAFPQEARIWTIAVAAIACISLAVGNIAALVQRNVKRLLAYSSISQAGFMLIAVSVNTHLGAQALVFFLIPYSAMSIGAFAVIAARERELRQPVTLDNIGGFGWERPLLGVGLSLFMFGFAGMPLTGGLWAKVYVFSSAYQRGWAWLMIIGVIATAISIYYYLRVIRALWMRPAAELQLAPLGGSPPPERLLQVGVALCVAVTLVTFFVPEPFVELARHAAASLPL